MTVRAEKIAAALFAIYFAYFLKCTILDYATEPKVIGGVDLDRPIPQFVPWTPVYYPMMLSAAFAYWIWPTKAYTSLARRMAGGSFAIVRATYFTMFISFFCALSGEFYSSLPHLLKMEILLGPVGVFLGALRGTAIFGIFHALAFIPVSIIVGSLIAFGAHLVQRLFGSGVRPTPQSTPAFLRTSNEWPWVSVIAGAIALTITAAGFGQGGIFVVVVWLMIFFTLALPCIAVGAAIGFFAKHWAWCVAASLPIAYCMSMLNPRPIGILASQSLDFPPVLFTTLVGFGAMRWLAARLFAQKDAPARLSGR